MSALKGFQSFFNSIESVYNGTKYVLGSAYATYSKVNTDKFALDVTQKALARLSTGHALDASGSTRRILRDTGHSILVDQVIKFTSGSNQYAEAHVEKVLDANNVLLSTQLPNAPGADNYSIYRYVTPTVNLAGSTSIVEGITTVVDFLDGESLVPTGGNVIPASAAAPLQVVAVLAADVTRIQVISDVGEFINLYTDVAGAVLIAHLVLTPDEIIDIDIPAGTSVYIRAAKNVAIDQAASILSMNFIG